MPCYHPVTVYRTSDGISFSPKNKNILGDIQIPCGNCIGCRLRRASDWALRCTHEASQWEENCFITLTYKRDALPPNGSLDYKDFQDFMKRLRKQTTNKIRFFMCGEYGPQTLRPHYHACLFNLDFPDKLIGGKSESGETYYTSATLDKIWTHGRTTVQPFTKQTAAYTARYIMTKINGDLQKAHYETIDKTTGELINRQPEFSHASLKPGIGATWFAKYNKDVFPHDHIIQDGKKHQVPKYYDKLRKDMPIGKQYDDRIEYTRYQDALKTRSDQTPERLRVREQVKTAQISQQKRTN
nr:MAG TPA: Replication associated protein [Microviridae sp.]